MAYIDCQSPRWVLGRGKTRNLLRFLSLTPRLEQVLHQRLAGRCAPTRPTAPARGHPGPPRPAPLRLGRRESSEGSGPKIAGEPTLDAPMGVHGGLG